MGEELNISEAKGLYTFTATEKIQFRYAVVASNWEEAREEIAHGNTLRLAAGDHSGGEYMGESEPRREILLRKTTCIIDKLTLTIPTYRDEEGDHLYYNPDHSEMLLYKPSDGGSWGFNLDEDYGCSFNVVQVNEKGICSHCERMIDDRNWQIALEQKYGKGNSEVLYSPSHGFKNEEDMKAAKIQKGISDHADQLNLWANNPHCYEADGSSVYVDGNSDRKNVRIDGRKLVNGAGYANGLPTWVSVSVDESELTKDNILDHVLEVYDAEEGWSAYKGDAQ